MRGGRVRSVLALAIGVWAIQGGVALAHSEHPTPENFGGESPNIVNDFGEHYINTNNPEVRWDWACHQFAVPGQGDENANQDHAAMRDRPGDSGLVAPGDKSTACT